MKIELKRLAIYERMSEETTAFNADVYIDGIKAGYAKNDGHGGCTFVHAYEGKHQLIKEAEEYCKKLPPHPSEFSKDGLPMSLDFHIDLLVEEELKKRDQKKFEKKMEKAILWGVKGGTRYTQVSFKVPLSQIPVAQLQQYVDKYKKEFKPNEVFLNTNLEKLGIKI